MNLGARAHDFGKLPVEELARQIAAHGLNCIQLSPVRALAGCDDDTHGFDAVYARGIRETFANHGIRVSVLGCYINLGDRDEASRRPQLERFKHHLRAAPRLRLRHPRHRDRLAQLRLLPPPRQRWSGGLQDRAGEHPQTRA